MKKSLLAILWLPSFLQEDLSFFFFFFLWSNVLKLTTWEFYPTQFVYQNDFPDVVGVVLLFPLIILLST